MQTATRPVPERSELDEHVHAALGEGRLIFQRTEQNVWLPGQWLSTFVAAEQDS